MMKIITLLLSLFVLTFAGPILVRNYESADLNNFKGPVIEKSTDIVQVDLTENYLSLRGVDVGTSYTVTNYVNDGLNGAFDIADSIRGYYIFNEKLILIHLNEDKMEIFYF